MSRFVAKDKDGNVVEPGTAVTNYRGEAGVFKQSTRANTEGKDGKVVVTMPGGWEPEHYASVWSLTVEDADRD